LFVCAAFVVIPLPGFAASDGGGVVTLYPGTGVYRPADITAGPDGAMWFTNASSSIGRVAMDGTISNYRVNGLAGPHSIVATGAASGFTATTTFRLN
jgi:virginiamycin B lyase